MLRDDEESSTTLRDVLDDAIRFWERGRVVYNLALTGLVITWVVVTWPHFRPAFTLPSLLRLLVLAAIANVCYTTAYLIDIPIQHSSFRVVWRRRRWVLWVLGTLLALLIAQYWIGDEIYPFVGAAYEH